MRARAALFRHLQVMFETHLRGVFRFDDFEPYVAQDAQPETKGKRRWAYGKTKEIVEGRVGDFEILIASPLEVPPLGRVSLRIFDGPVLVTGPMDVTTFDLVGKAIMLHQQEEKV